MRHWLRGALGAAMVYPLVWYYSAPGPRLAAVRAPGAPVALSEPGVAVTALPSSLTHEPGAPERLVVSERPPAPTSLDAAGHVVGPSVATVQEPSVPLAVMPELREAISRAAEVQQHAANPADLERHVQTLEEDPVKLAKLRALAEMFVQLPAPRPESYLPSSERSPPSRSR